MNLSEARDTQTLTALLSPENSSTTFDVLDAGTAMRFLTAYLAVSTEKAVTLTGTERMQQRPIGTLVDSLKEIGADIKYLKSAGFPPMEINALKEQKKNKIIIPGNISSQYISALLMVAPTLPQGLVIEIVPPIYSIPYINMTISLMEKAGIKVIQEANTYTISKQEYKTISHTVESDWSAASYWYSYIALSPLGSEILLKGLMKKSYQGDQAIVEIMENLGVKTTFNNEGAHLKKVSSPGSSLLSIDFKKFPDLAQTVLVCCAPLKVNLQLSGLESLRIKETDRIAALQAELGKFGCQLIEEEAGKWFFNSENFIAEENISIHTYEDHRMAMSFAPLALIAPLTIEDVDVVKKSYPGFWKDLDSVGMELIEK
ncbi:3-phosphoshikimate 1-carboxyvinyltransferase [Marivirga lumbricoides]|uniref:3-phosphoshikimate 1-carboxyvinyltransferase n=3 Tax=Marivirga lumbricoides TaxID=1046115 RepID=A0ABQ1MZ45_9BACT|nr:3-phosphoshikimate 1-carboxyvinyltransferase [Marivirga lumbricoides]